MFQISFYSILQPSFAVDGLMNTVLKYLMAISKGISLIISVEFLGVIFTFLVLVNQATYLFLDDLL